MLDSKFLRENLEIVREKLQQRGEEANIEKFAEFDQQRRNILQETEQLKHQRNVFSQKISDLRKQGLEPEKDNFLEMKEISSKIKELDEKLKNIQINIESILHMIPNIPHETVPIGKDEKDNTVVRQWGEIKDFQFTPKRL